jgi:pimeloyl-ACP methyl ester carboxylesterase
MLLFQSLGLSKFHLLGHHSGAGLATEIASEHPSSVLTLCLIGAAIMTRSEQVSLNALINVPLNQPEVSDAHLQKTWDYLASHGVGDDLEFKQSEAIDHIRAWKGKNHIYACVFNQDMWGFFEKVTCEVMVMCARDDVLWPYIKNVKVILSTCE